jgi:hypothetical protein
MTVDPPVDATVDYRPVSPLAVAALVAGCASTLAVITRFAWAVPLVGIALAAAALADVARPEARKAGRLAALAALALSMGFGAQAVTGQFVDRWIMASRAKAAARAWIEALREGRTSEALRLSAATVLPPSSLSPDLEHEEAESERLKRFSELPAVRAVAGCAASTPPIIQAAAFGTDDGAWTLRADLDSCGSPDATLNLVVVPKRVRGITGDVEQWRVVSTAVDR